MSYLRDLLATNQSELVESRLLSSTAEFFKIVEEIDAYHFEGVQPLTQVSVIDRLQKTQLALNEEATRSIMERFGFKGINLDNIEDVFNPATSGLPTMKATRTHLIQKGMSEELVDKLARRYIQKIESSADVKIFSLMDLFNTAQPDNSAALSALIALPTLSSPSLHLSYQTWQEYTQSLVDSRVYSALRFATKQPFPVQSMFATHNPVRPHMRNFGGSTRGFSTSNAKDRAQLNQDFLEKNQQQQQQDGGKSKSKFFEFIQKVDALDQKPDTPAATVAAKESEDYDISELDISFEKVRSTEAKTGAAETATSQEDAKAGEQGEAKSKLTEEQLRLRAEREQLVHEAKKKYSYSFFKNFAFSGPDQMELSQRSLEEYIMNLESVQDVQALIISLVNSSYELNSLIPNVEMLFYRMFCSPLATKEDRAGKDHENILYGNIFA